MSGQEVWHTAPDGTLAADLDGLHLVVRSTTSCARFMVVRGGIPGGAIIASGTEDDVRAAMRAAERLAGRLAARDRASRTA